ncbi:Splicing factor 3B subunit 1 [Crenichthys baileyi]|uniref:Splicing factor 3B subunit 1 n=1 Tax=Crenichthys baileyi TaxID=28760 RepID=A0AAV9RLN6_9TELE
MAAASAGRSSNQKNVGNSDINIDLHIPVVERDCSMSGSGVGSWGDMIDIDVDEEVNAGQQNGQRNVDRQAKCNKRKKKTPREETELRKTHFRSQYRATTTKMAKIAKTHEDIEAQILEIQGMKATLQEENGEQGVGLVSTGFYDQEIYGGSDSRFAGYVTSIAANEQEDDDEDETSTSLLGQKKPGYHAPVAILNSIPQSDEQYDPFAEHRPQKIADREDEYKARRRQMIISPERLDPFADGGKTPDPKLQVRSYVDVMMEQNLSKEEAALRQITDKAREFGAGPLFNQILPLLMSPTLEDQERHLLVKVIDRILYKLDDLVRPYVHKILVVIEPLLIDEDYYARVEGREIISNLAKAAGLATMISTMRPDIDNMDEYVRNTTARAFAVVASALGIPSLLPFLKAVCKSKKSWQARHTGIKIVQQIAILMGCAILPHLRSLVEIIEHGLVDEQQKVRTISALAIAALAEAATPYGIESFDSVLKPLWKGIRQHRGKGLAAFLKAIGYLIPLMDAEYANYYTREVMLILIREFQSPDEEMKKIVLKVVKQCCGTDGVEANYIKTEILPPFFKHFWQHRMALDRRNYRQLVDTTVELANKVGAAEIISRIVDDLKDEAEQYRKMVMETIEKIMGNLGAADIDHKLEEQLIDGILYAFQEQTTEDSVMLNGFGTVVNALGKRVKPYLPQICGTVLWRLNNKSAKVRQQAADLISRTAVVMKTCQEEKLMGHLGVVLYEYLGEEYPEVLGSILGALKAIVNVIGMHKMTPPIKDLLPRLTPILKNRHEKVQENCIDLVGRIADRGAEYVSAREWMRICFELLELLKAHKKAIRRATVNTFGYIAKAIGPHDVLATLLNNLKVQERQNRVCTTVAIAIVAETCSPFTVLPALMNEYRVPELNVQNGVLKSLSFLFEYIGEMGKDYIYAVTPLLEDALMDRDLVHRQTASAVVQHMSLGVYGFGCEDSLNHLLNYVWPNVFETSPHVIQAVMGALEGLRVALGPCRMLQYCLQGLFHPARKVRDVYWKIYNSIYIGSQDALIAHYPQVYNDEKNVYVRYELEYVL